MLRGSGKVDLRNGFSLVELLVAMTLGLAMSSALVNLYVGSKKNYVQDDELSRMQENARYALRLLSRELGMSGFMGRLIRFSGITTQVVGSGCVTGSSWALTPSRFVELVNDYGGGAITTASGTTFNCLNAADLSTDSDLFTVKRTGDEKSVDNGALVNGAVDDDQWYLRVVDYGATTGYQRIASGASVPSGDLVAGNLVDYWEYYANIFYVRNYTINAGDGIPSLCNTALVGNSFTSVCYVEGVENMQVEFGVDTNGDQQAEYFTASPSSAEMGNAIAIRIFLLMRSINTISGYTNDKVYRLGTTAINPDVNGDPQAFNDGFYRRIFNTTVNLRNPVRL